MFLKASFFGTKTGRKIPVTCQVFGSFESKWYVHLSWVETAKFNKIKANLTPSKAVKSGNRTPGCPYKFEHTIKWCHSPTSYSWELGPKKLFFFWFGMFFFPTFPPRSLIGSVLCVPAYTLSSSSAFKGMTRGMDFKHTCYPRYMQVQPGGLEQTNNDRGQSYLNFESIWAKKFTL